MTQPRIVLGMPAYNRPDALPQVLESLLLQTSQDFALVIVDDRPTPEVRAVVDRYAARFPHLHYEPNPVRLGMVGNWRKAFERGRQLYPGSDYFAWVSDHDVWHPRWLEVLSAELDANPRLVLAYPQMQRVFATHRRAIRRGFDTVGMTSPLARVRSVSTSTRMTAGNCIYGLFRTRALERAGVFRPVLAPDRQVLVELLLFGEFKHVAETLWYREVAGAFSYGRQRQMFFPTHVPLHTYLPANLQHFGVLLWDLVIHRRGRPDFGRLAGLGYALTHLWYSSWRELLKDDARWRIALQRTAVGRRVLGAAAPVRADS
jgi:glycosyltransferase involved in cell wall biosynthesis